MPVPCFPKKGLNYYDFTCHESLKLITIQPFACGTASCPEAYSPEGEGFSELLLYKVFFINQQKTKGWGACLLLCLEKG